MAGFGAERAELRKRAGTKKLRTILYSPPDAEDNKSGKHLVHFDHNEPHGVERRSFDSAAEAMGHIANKLGVTHEQLAGLKLPGKVGPSESAEPGLSKSDFE